MKKILIIFTTFFCFNATYSQVDTNNMFNVPIPKKVKYIYKHITNNNNLFEEEAFMNSQLQPSIREMFLSRLPDTVAIEVKKLNNGEFTEPIFIDKTCYIIKRIDKRLFKYKLNIIYFDETPEILSDLPKRKR